MTDAERFWSHVDKRKDHWLWTGNAQRNGGIFILGKRPHRQRVSARRYAFQLAKSRLLRSDENVLLECSESNCVLHLRLADEHSSPVVIRRFWEKVDKNGPTKVAALGPCWVWLGRTHKFGYGLITTGKKPHRRQCLAHRYAWEIEHGELQEGECVLHACDHPPCVRHLFKGTQQDNLADMRAKGRQARGPRKKK